MANPIDATATQHQSTDQNPDNMLMWTVAWVGGWDQPSFQSFTTIEAAQEVFEATKVHADDPADRVLLLGHFARHDGGVGVQVHIDFSPLGQAEDGEDEDGDEASEGNEV